MKILHSRFIISALIAFIVLVVFWQSIHENFVWDDDLFMNMSSIYHGKEGIKNAFTKPFNIVDLYWRPFVVVTFPIIGFDTDGGALKQHIFNLFLHVSSSILIFLCCLEIMFQRRKAVGAQDQGDTGDGFAYIVSFFCAIVYATHPLTVESVAWISGRFDLMLTFFLLLFIYTDLKLKNGTIVKWILLFLFYLLAAGSKEMAVMLPVALPFIWLLLYRPPGKLGVRNLVDILKIKKWTLTAIVLAGLLYLVLRIYNLGAIFAGDLNAYTGFENDCFLCRPMYSARAILEFMRLVFLPAVYSGPLHLYDFPEGTGIIISGIVIWMAMLAFVFYFIRKNNLLVPFLVFVIIAFPTLRLTFLSVDEQLICNRFALAPFALLIITFFPVWSIFIFKSVSSLQKPIIIILATTGLAWIFANVIITMQTIPFWRTSNSIYTYMYKMHPESSFSRKFYIETLLIDGRNDEALEMLLDGKDFSDGTMKASFDEIMQLAILDINTKNYKRAKGFLTHIVNSKEDYLNFIGTRRLSRVYCALMEVESALGNFEQSVTAGEMSLKLEPERVYCRILYTDALYKSGRVLDALKNKEIIMSNPLAEVRDEMQRVSSHWGDEEAVDQ